MRTNELIITVVIFLSLIIGAYFYPAMPDDIASHWNAVGEVDGYLPKSWSLFLMPLVLIASLLIIALIPSLDPLKANIEKFRGHYDNFSIILVLFLFYIYLLTVFWNIGMKFNMMQLMAPAFTVLFYYTGVMVENSKKNWFIGIRTPWTMSSERVWNKTHKVGGKLFKVVGVIALLGIFFPYYSLLIILVPILLVAAYTALYSYLEYNKEARR
ncbi:MAG: SdpI family protein [Candidatus Micrarchaeota archaeon]|nr:SdpI family protein [Candidatus Micrarchaeota archaeon]